MITFRFFIIILALSLFAAHAKNNSDTELRKSVLEFITPIESSEFNKEKNSLSELGQKLYFDAKLSANGTISCNSCHNLVTYGVDNEATSPGHDKTRGGRNSPTVYNAKFNFVQFWDGRAKDLAEQATGPLLNPIEHGIKDEAALVEILNKAEYVDLFAKAFNKDKKPITLKNVGIAIAAFEEHLVTESAFDEFLRGKDNALNGKQKRGLKKFVEVGCVSCHQGVNLGGTMFQKIGLVNEYKTADLGRFDVTKNEDDKYFFKVPGLRNIEKTGPYFHDGKVKTLKEAITLMAYHQLGERLKPNEVSDIEQFLKSLTSKKLPQFK
jgi:cytochrome c peroxidase